MNEQYEKLRAQRLAKVNDEYRSLLENLPPLRTMGVEGLREALAGVGAGMDITSGVAVRDMAIDGPNGPVPTRIYTPENYSGPKLGVYVHTHAGGFVGGGGVGTWDWMNTMLAARVPCVVVAPDFRLPPENRFPTGLQDCWAVLNWVAQQGDAQGWDVSRLAVGGGCSGGNMAAVLSLMARDAGGPALSLQILESWVADGRGGSPSQIEFAEGYGLRRADNDFVLENYVRSESDLDDWRVSPLKVESVQGVAPAMITVGEWDILKDEDLAYAERLRQAGVPVEAHVISNMGHFPNPEFAEDLHALHIKALKATIGPRGEYRIAPPIEVANATPARSDTISEQVLGQWTLRVKTPMGLKTDQFELRRADGKLLEIGRAHV
jgi:acetyl esterase